MSEETKTQEQEKKVTVEEAAETATAAETAEATAEPKNAEPKAEAPEAAKAEAAKAEEAKAEEAKAEEAKAEATAEAKAEEAKAEEAKVAEIDPLAVAQAKVAELEDRYLRCRAEFDNYRKRMARENSDARDATRRQTITDFLTVYDYFSMGMAAISQAADVNTLKVGMEMIWAEFQKVLDGFGVKIIESVGKPFDAHFHEAVSQEASDTVPEGTVIRQYKAAFQIGDKLLRPAVVVVSSGPEKAAEPEAASEPETEKPAE